MINVKDLNEKFNERMEDKYEELITNFEEFIDKQLLNTNNSARITKWDFLNIINKTYKLNTRKFTNYNKAFKVFGNIIYYSRRYIYEGECVNSSKAYKIIDYLFGRYVKNGYYLHCDKIQNKSKRRCSREYEICITKRQIIE